MLPVGIATAVLTFLKREGKTQMTYDPSKPPPPFGLFVIGKHGAKFKVRIGSLTKIVDREKVLQWAAERKAAGGPVQLSPYLTEAGQ